MHFNSWRGGEVGDIMSGTAISKLIVDKVEIVILATGMKAPDQKSIMLPQREQVVTKVVAFSIHHIS